MLLRAFYRFKGCSELRAFYRFKEFSIDSKNVVTTHTNRYLDYNSDHDYKHKISTATTLINGSLTLPTHEESKRRELNRVSDALVMNGYPHKLISSLLTLNTRERRLRPAHKN